MTEIIVERNTVYSGWKDNLFVEQPLRICLLWKGGSCSIPLGQCAPLLGACSGLEETGQLYTNPANWIGTSVMPLSRLVASRDTTHGVLRSREWVPWVGTVRTVSWWMCPSLVLKNRHVKCRPIYLKMLYLPLMITKVVFVQKMLWTTSTHMIW